MPATRLLSALLIGSLLSSSVTTVAQTSVQKIEPVSFSQVQIEDGFWKPRLSQVSRVTIPVCIDQTEVKTPRIRNSPK
jgi:hypothetical protein